VLQLGTVLTGERFIVNQQDLYQVCLQTEYTRDFCLVDAANQFFANNSWVKFVVSAME
jgi:hypothetical protein